MSEKGRLDFSKLKPKDPLLILGALVAILLVIYHVTSPEETETGGERLKADQEAGLDDLGKAQAQLQKRLEDRLKEFTEDRNLETERERARQAELRLQQIEDEFARGETPMQKRKPIEEIRFNGQFASVEKVKKPAGLTGSNRVGRSFPSLPETRPAFEPTPKPKMDRHDPRSAKENMALLRAGVWVPVILDHDIYAGSKGTALGTVTHDVMDALGTRRAIPKGSKVLLEVIHDDAYYVTAIVGKKITRPDGLEVPIPKPVAVHEVTGSKDLDVRKTGGKLRTHLLKKIGITTLVAAIDTLPALVAGNEEASDIAQLQVLNQTSKKSATLLEQALQMPREKWFFAGKPIMLFFTEDVQIPGYGRRMSSQERAKVYMDDVKKKFAKELESIGGQQ